MAKFLKAVLLEPSLLVPHVSTDLNCIDFHALKRAGVRAVVFDKDNTLTFPDAPTLDDSIKASLNTCKAVFGDKVAVLSNSVGSRRDPSPHPQADAFERESGVSVIRYSGQKPFAGFEEAAALLGCDGSQMAIVGDRVLTDVLFGNRNGMLTFLVRPITNQGEGPLVPKLRAAEGLFYRTISSWNFVPPAHTCLEEYLKATGTRQ